MHVRILLQITGHDDSPGVAVELAAFEKTVERPEDLGLWLAEGKALTAAIQKRVVEAQVASWTERHRCCEACGVRRRSNGSYPVDQRASGKAARGRSGRESGRAA